MTALGESTYEAVFDHGGNGYGVWFDGVVRDDPMYKQFWKGTGTRPLYVRIEEDRIVLLKQLDRELPAGMHEPAGTESGASTDDVDVDAAIEEAVAEAMAAAEASAQEDATKQADERVFSPEEAAALFVAGGEAGDAPVESPQEPASDVDAEPAKPKRKTATRRKTTTRKPAASKDDTADAADDA